MSVMSLMFSDDWTIVIEYFRQILSVLDW